MKTSRRFRTHTISMAALRLVLLAPHEFDGSLVGDGLNLHTLPV